MELDNDRMLARLEVFGNEDTGIDLVAADPLEWSAVDMEEIKSGFARCIVMRCHGA